MWTCLSVLQGRAGGVAGTHTHAQTRSGRVTQLELGADLAHRCWHGRQLPVPANRKSMAGARRPEAAGLGQPSHGRAPAHPQRWLPPGPARPCSPGPQSPDQAREHQGEQHVRTGSWALGWCGLEAWAHCAQQVDLRAHRRQACRPTSIQGKRPERTGSPLGHAGDGAGFLSCCAPPFDLVQCRCVEGGG